MVCSNTVLIVFLSKVVGVTMVSQEMCPQMLGRGLPWNSEAMVCAGGRDKDACQVWKPVSTCLKIIM